MSNLIHCSDCNTNHMPHEPCDCKEKTACGAVTPTDGKANNHN